MKQLPLGRTGLTVSAFCLGSMTWGSQNTEAEGHAQIDMALDAGINFIDTAEMYPTNPVRAETVGRTEEIIGSWLKARGRRDGLVLATKITGEGQNAVRGGAPITGGLMAAAVEASLKRLRHRGDRPLPAALAQSRLVSFPPELELRSLGPGPGRDRGPYARPAPDRRQPDQGRQDPPFRAVERKRLGHRVVVAPGRGKRLAAGRLDPERIFAAVPALRYRPGRARRQRGPAAARLLAACRGAADRANTPAT